MAGLINGIHLHYVQAGQGPVLLFVHGFPLDHLLWQSQIDGLADVAHVIAPDLRGFGQSDAPEGVYTIESHADDLAALLDALQIERAIVCGLSMGGYIALAFWKKYAARVRGLILVDTRAGADSPAARQTRLDMAELVKQHGSAVAAKAMLPRLLGESTRQSHPDQIEFVRAMMLRQSPVGIIGAQRGMAERPDSTPLLPTINVPTLCIFGAEDVITPVEPEGKSMAAAIPGAKLAVIPNAGHLSNLEQPETFNAVIREFLALDWKCGNHMHQEETTSESGKSRLNVEELIDLFKHFDQIQASKENLFVPIILAFIPAILASWHDVDALVIFGAGLVSVLLYLYFLVVTLRFSSTETKLFKKIREFTSDIEEIVRYPRIFGIVRLRSYLLVIIILVWILLWYCKYIGK